MKSLGSLVACLSFVPAAFATTDHCPAMSAGSSCCAPAQPACCAAATPLAAGDMQAKRHPLRGVITAVHADRSALMVKHEEIPGVMRAMTMLFKVDEATLKAAKKGQAITGMMSREGNDWWLHDVKFVEEKKG